MRSLHATALILAMVALSACGRTANEAPVPADGPWVYAPGQELPTVYRTVPRDPVSTYRTRSPSQPPPRLATLLNRPEPTANPERAKVIPRSRPEEEKTDTGTRDAPPLPERDVVDLELKKVAARRAEAKKAAAPIRALRVTARPIPKPITATPRPEQRPSDAKAVAPERVAAAVPSVVAPRLVAPRPSIGGLPTLGAPRVVADATPVALPDPSRTETAIPIGRVPASLGSGNIRTREVASPVADRLEVSTADASGGIGWDEAAALMRAGEVQNAIDVGEFEVLMTLCSGRGVLTVQPTPGALAAVDMPKVICGKAVSQASP